jgi:hypothetical protein
MHLLNFVVLMVPDEGHKMCRFPLRCLLIPLLLGLTCDYCKTEAIYYQDCNVEGCSNGLVADGLIDQDESQFVLYHLLI